MSSSTKTPYSPDTQSVNFLLLFLFAPKLFYLCILPALSTKLRRILKNQSWQHVQMINIFINQKYMFPFFIGSYLETGAQMSPSKVELWHTPPPLLHYRYLLYLACLIKSTKHKSHTLLAGNWTVLTDMTKPVSIYTKCMVIIKCINNGGADLNENPSQTSVFLQYFPPLCLWGKIPWHGLENELI